jgi:hypothetical protein
MNNNFEFKSYIPTPNDQYMLGIAKVKLYGKLVVNFKHVKTKDGGSSFFCTQNYTLTDANNEKKYLPCVLLDSRNDEDELMDYIRENVNRVVALRSAQVNQAQQAAPVHYPHGMVQPRSTSMSEVAANEQLPF